MDKPRSDRCPIPSGWRARQGVDRCCLVVQLDIHVHTHEPPRRQVEERIVIHRDAEAKPRRSVDDRDKQGVRGHEERVRRWTTHLWERFCQAGGLCFSLSGGEYRGRAGCPRVSRGEWLNHLFGIVGNTDVAMKTQCKAAPPFSLARPDLRSHSFSLRSALCQPPSALYCLGGIRASRIGSIHRLLGMS